jgi:hypothetical protein
VILLPDITGEHASPLRNVAQPGIGVRVYGNDGSDGIEGIVNQVVINPQNRLVTHAIVHERYPDNGRNAWFDYLISVESMLVVDLGGILLNQRTSVISRFPIFDPANYPFAPLTWQPPYPYTVGSVRWPLQGQASTSQTNPAEAGI